MKNSNKNGFALIGVLIAVFIIAAISYSLYFNSGKKKNSPDGIKTDLPSVKNQMTDLQKQVDQRNASQMEVLNDAQKKATTTE